MFLLATIVLTLFAIALYLFYSSPPLSPQLLALQAKHNTSQARHVPRPLFSIPAGIDFVRALKERRGLLHIQSEFAQYGHTFTQYLLGRFYIWTEDPANIREVLSIQSSFWNLGNIRRWAVSPLIGHGIFVAEGARWTHLRGAIRPSFNKVQIVDLEMYETHVQDLIARIPRKGETIELQELMFNFALDVTTDFLFGYSINSLRDDFDPVYEELNGAFSHGLSRVWPRSRMGIFMDLLPDPEFRKSCKTTKHVVEKLVKQALSTRPSPDAEKQLNGHRERYIYLHEIAASTEDITELRDHALSILLAGKDTTAAALSSTFFLLARHPEVWKKMSAEIAELKGEIPSYERLNKLKYLHQVISEVLRLYPPVPINIRRACADTYLSRGGGILGEKPILVPKGTTLFYSVFAMHRRKDLWGEDADEFRPERWEGRHPGPEFLPFNSGPRVCIGQSFAMTEMAYVILRFVQTFESIESRDDKPWEERLTVNLSSFHGVKVGLVVKKK